MTDGAAAPPPELRASAGIAELGARIIVHGKDLHRDCLDMSFVHYLLFSATGRWFDARRARVLEQLWIATGYPDARIWCNRIAGYLGSARVDPALAMSAALAASNSVAYGFGAVQGAYDVQAEIPSDPAARERWLEQALESRRILPGYGRPVHGHDERVAVALKTLADAGLRAGPALAGAFWLRRRLGEAKGIDINIAAVMAAVAIDFGITRQDYAAFMLLMLAPGYAAVYADQRARAPLAFLAGHQTRG